MGDKQILIGDLHRIINVRLEELFLLVRADLEQKKLMGSISAGVLLSGGVARTPGINELAQEIFRLNVLTSAEKRADQDSRILRPETLAGIGLAQHAAKHFKARGRRKRGFFKWLT